MYTKEELVESYMVHYDDLCKYATALTGSRDKGFDIIQMLAVRILELDNDIVIRDMESLLFTVAKRIMIDVYRKEKRIIPMTPDEMEQPYLIDFEQNLQQQELERAINESLKMYPPNMRNIFIRNKLHGESIASISEETGINSALLRKRISRMIGKIPKDILLFTIFISAINEIVRHTSGFSNVI